MLYYYMTIKLEAICSSETSVAFVGLHKVTSKNTQILICYATNRKVAGSIPDEVIF
jgi:hypothetical protein